ncbi:hypothetical protein LTR37_001455 [Vermiconidia calcicola]|uniref:Uncharacterized protein n=1 Tax=Vermiconidia calcicola TaxID=1690605 RepID=A0ACC3NWM9_9PEZI|nr:hypothetical protein LTR37_001455 [Vermiconidia calcicola]
MPSFDTLPNEILLKIMKMDILQSRVFWWGFGCSEPKRLGYLETRKVCESIHEAADEAFWEFYTSRCVIVARGPFCPYQTTVRNPTTPMSLHFKQAQSLDDSARRAFVEVQYRTWDNEREQELFAILNRQISSLIQTPVAEIEVIVTTHDKEAHASLLAAIDAALASSERHTDRNIKKSISVDLLRGNSFYYNRSILNKGRRLYI